MSAHLEYGYQHTSVPRPFHGPSAPSPKTITIVLDTDKLNSINTRLNNGNGLQVAEVMESWNVQLPPLKDARMMISKALLKFDNARIHYDTSAFFEIRSKDFKNAFSYDTITQAPSNLLLLANLHGYNITGPAPDNLLIGGSQEIVMPDHEQRQLYVDFPNHPGGMFQLNLTLRERTQANVPLTFISTLAITLHIIEN
jgi:hypothetical protein